jgi:hypothetical protein
MIPVKNVNHGHFQVGDLWNGRVIVALSPCSHANICRNRYRNFDVACGGQSRLHARYPEAVSPFTRCPFHICPEDRNYLTNRVGGSPCV